MRRLLLMLALLALPAVGQAQCVMCSLSAENAGEPKAVNRTLLTAMAVLLVPTVGMLAGAGVLAYKLRRPGSLLGDDAAE